MASSSRKRKEKDHVPQEEAEKRHWEEQYEMWLKSPHFDEWTLAREKWPYSFRWRIRTIEEVRATYRNRAKVWDGWFRMPPQLKNPRSKSSQYKQCEPISSCAI
ncbi:hypothetical protein R1sor_026650 [Riccia sorocarpa]|uniref:Uncharacterized protein n=1 Tax=Riccia sorocarpa TaxID=122646 RepID=A0ABD3GEV0_9MARC